MEKKVEGERPVKFLIVFVLFILFGVLAARQGEDTNTPPPLQPAATPQQTARAPSPAGETDYDSEIVALGKSIFSQAKEKYSPKSTYIDVWGSGYPDAAAALFIPEKVWDSLPEEKREALAVFIQSEIPEIRSNPDKYIAFAKGAALHERLRSNISKMADGRYVIMTTIERGGNWIKDKTVAEDVDEDSVSQDR